jgi:hypothetical protein
MHLIGVMMSKDEMVEYRYEESGDRYFLKKWYGGKETTIRGLLNQQPKWLSDIINLAKVGGHAKPIHEPPPNYIVWFCTTLDGELIKYIELEKF